MLVLDRVSEATQLRAARHVVGMTLFDVGSRAGVSPPRLSEYERGRLALAPDAVARVRSVLVAAGAPLTADVDGEAA